MGVDEPADAVSLDFEAHVGDEFWIRDERARRRGSGIIAQAVALTLGPDADEEPHRCPADARRRTGRRIGVQLQRHIESVAGGDAGLVFGRHQRDERAVGGRHGEKVFLVERRPDEAPNPAVLRRRDGH